MSRQEFLDNFRVARNLFLHSQVSATGPRLDPGPTERTPARADIWLTPASVKGFAGDDFAELGADGQRELGDAVHDFEVAASHASPSQPVTDAHYQAAAAAFQAIMKILDPFLPTRGEAATVHDAIQTVDFPDSVVNWDYALGRDADDTPAIWVTAFVDQSTVTGNQLGRLVLDLTAKLRRALSAAGFTWWPYVNVRSVAEYMAR